MSKLIPVQQLTAFNLGNLQEKIVQLQQLNSIWQKYIDLDLMKHTRVANWRDNCLIIEIDNAAWATHVRYALPDLLRKLKTEKELSELKNIRWYIKPANQTNANQKKSSIPPLTSASSELIQETAQHISNEKLQKALAALAKNIK